MFFPDEIVVVRANCLILEFVGASRPLCREVVLGGEGLCCGVLV